MSKNKYWIAFGDVHENTAGVGRIPGLAEADGVIITGDLTNRGTRGAIEKVYSAVYQVNPNILAQIGNMDGQVADGFLTEKGANIHLQVRELAQGLGLMGVGWSPPTPFGTPSEVPDPQIGRWLDETYENAKDFEHLIVVVHAPPMDTATDVLGTGVHVGSPSVRAFIERVQPDICLTGHIHESRAVDHIGRTMVLNPGMLSGGGYAVVEYGPDGPSARLESW